MGTRANIIMSSPQVWTKKILCHRQLPCGTRQLLHNTNHDTKFSTLPHLSSGVKSNNRKSFTTFSWSSSMQVWTTSSSSIRHFSSSDHDTPQKEQKESAIFPRPLPDPTNSRHASLVLPKTWEEWKTVWNGAWTEYKKTWQGFALGGREVTPKSSPEKDVDQQLDDLQTKFNTARGDIQSNVERNLKVVQKDGTELVETLKDRTGIYTTEDLKQWVADQLKLATECLSQFMAGYRKGRDDEIDKMLNEYFKELEEEEEDEDNEKEKKSDARNMKPRRRKPKRRILNR